MFLMGKKNRHQNYLIAVEPYGSKANDKYQSSLATDLTVEIYRLWGGAY